MLGDSSSASTPGLSHCPRTCPRGLQGCTATETPGSSHPPSCAQPSAPLSHLRVSELRVLCRVARPGCLPELWKFPALPVPCLGLAHRTTWSLWFRLFCWIRRRERKSRLSPRPQPGSVIWEPPAHVRSPELLRATRADQRQLKRGVCVLKLPKYVHTGSTRQEYNHIESSD